MTTMIHRAMSAAAVLALATGAAACHPARLGQGRPRDDRPMAVNARLDCPQHEGDLRLTDQASDGRSCGYSGDGGEEVTLGLLALNGRPAADALVPTEAELRGLVPAAVSGSPENAKAEAASKAKDDDDDDKKDGDGDDKTNWTGPKTIAANGTTTSDESDNRHGHVAINLPGVHLDADENGARVHAFGQDVVASDNGANVHTGWNGVQSQIHANDGGVEMRSGWTGQHALDLSYLLASDTAGPGGVQAAGYMVRGPIGGPLVLAVVKARSGGDSTDSDRFDDVKHLVRRNTHVE